MSELPDEGDGSGLLPAPLLCNQFNNPNPIYGKGALGNENAGRMLYSGDDARDLVETLQRMLLALDYNLGSSGPKEDGVDGIFGERTEKAVLDFQKAHKDWDGNQLKVDGLVGPRTSDALNRAMVGKLYSHYQTPEKLLGGEPVHTVTSKFLSNGLVIEPGKTQTGKIFLVYTPKKAELFDKRVKPFRVRVVDPYLEPYIDKKFRLSIGREFELLDRTKEDGTIEGDIPFDALQIDLDLWTDSFEEETPMRWSIEVGPIPPESTPEGASIRLKNLGYYAGDITKEMTEPLRDAIKFFQWDLVELDITGELDQETCKKLKEVHDL